VTNAASELEPMLAADHTTKGRFALTILDSSGTENQVYVTNDSGATRRGPTNVAEPPRTPASSLG
jgi:hypothetical protein